MTVLVIDDDASVASVLRRAFTLDGYAVEVAPDGEAGLEATRRLEPDLVILDYDLPKLNGLRVMSELRSSHPVLPVVFFTGRDDPEVQAQALAAGASRFLLKPVSVTTMLGEARSLLKRKN